MTVSSTARRRQGERLRLLPLQREVAPTAAALQGRAYPRRHRQGAADSIMAMVPAARPACNGSQSSHVKQRSKEQRSNEQWATQGVQGAQGTRSKGAKGQGAQRIEKALRRAVEVKGPAPPAGLWMGRPPDASAAASRQPAAGPPAPRPRAAAAQDSAPGWRRSSRRRRRDGQR